LELEGHLLVQVGFPSPLLYANVPRTNVCVSIPFGVLAVLGIYALWPEDRPNRPGTMATVSKIDFLGNAMLAAASIILVFAMQEAGSFVWSWSSPVIVWSLVTSGACWVLLGVWEYCLSHVFSQQIQPIFPMHLVGSRVYVSCLLYSHLSRSLTPFAR
jgi:hypothetical protein